MTKTLKTGAFAFFFSLAAVQAAMALPATMELAGATSQPIGHYEFCKNYSDECRSNGEDSGPLTLTPENWKTIVNVNYTANVDFAPLTDMEIYGVEELWTYPETAADCEDYVLIKRKNLIEAGISPSNLLITVVLQPSGQGHAVLTLRTDRGDFVLDNMRNKILLWSETEYRYLKRQSSANAGKWVKLQDGRADAVGSVK
jgi:predicted transglutaminase-like cysteine proteinase